MTATLKLYEIAQARDVLDAWLAESEGELTPELETMLNELDGQADEKIERVALFVRERQAQAKAVREERDRLDAIVKREEKAAESLKSYLKFQMERLGKIKVNGLLATVAIQRNSQPSVTHGLPDDTLRACYLTSGTADEQLPGVGQFVRETISYRIDRDAVLAAQKAGDLIPSEIVVDLGTHIRIR